MDPGGADGPLTANDGKPPDATLPPDAACAPQVIMRKSSTEVSHYSLDAQKKWKAAAVTLAPLSGHSISSLYGLVRGRDGKQHLLLKGYQSGTGGGERILHGTLGAGTSWTFKSLPAIKFTKLHEQHSSFPYNLLFNFAVDSKGGLHAVFNNDGAPTRSTPATNPW